MTALDAGLLSRWLVIGVCLVAPPVLVALIFNPVFKTNTTAPQPQRHLSNINAS